jgi:RNA polymerase sigma-70 factor (ECF subfamily)
MASQIQPTTPGDEELVHLAQQGSLEAFTALYERYLPVVFRRVNCMIPQADVEDVTQEVFISAMRSLKGFRGEARFYTWLRTIVNREIVNYYRRRNPVDTAVDIEMTCIDYRAHSQLTVSPPAAAIDNVILVRQALCKLPEKYQEIILLRFVDELQFNQIAQHFGQSLEATKSLFRRAMAALQKEVEGANA